MLILSSPVFLNWTLNHRSSSVLSSNNFPSSQYNTFSTPFFLRASSLTTKSADRDAVETSTCRSIVGIFPFGSLHRLSIIFAIFVSPSKASKTPFEPVDSRMEVLMSKPSSPRASLVCHKMLEKSFDPAHSIKKINSSPPCELNIFG